MPLYEYQCVACGKEFEALVRGGETAACPECGTDRLNKRFSVPSAHVQGRANLPMAAMPEAGCSRPGCGPGGCAWGG